MSINYRKRIKVAKGTRLNISKSRVSTTVGKQGLNVNIGANGTFLNMGIPGTGLYKRTRISSGKNDVNYGDMPNLTDVDNKGNRNAFYGCLMSWPRFILWCVLLGCFWAGISQILFGGYPILETILLFGISVGCYVALIYMNRGNSAYDVRPTTKSRVFLILLLAINLIGASLTYPSFKEHNKGRIEVVAESYQSTTDGEEEGKYLYYHLLSFFIVMSTLFALGIINNEKRPRKQKKNYIGEQEEPIHSKYQPSYSKSTVDREELKREDLDERFEEAARLVVTYKKASTPFLQTSLSMGFAKAAKVMNQLEMAGIIGPQVGTNPRSILVNSISELESILLNLK